MRLAGLADGDQYAAAKIRYHQKALRSSGNHLEDMVVSEHFDCIFRIEENS